MKKELTERYWNFLCELAREYKTICEKEEEFSPFFHHFEKSGINIIVFKGSELDGNTVLDYLNTRPMEGEDGMDSSFNNCDV